MCRYGFSLLAEAVVKKRKRADRQDPDARVCLHVYTNPPAGSAPGHGRGLHEHRAGPTCGPERPVLTDPRSPETNRPSAPTKKGFCRGFCKSGKGFCRASAPLHRVKAYARPVRTLPRAAPATPLRPPEPPEPTPSGPARSRGCRPRGPARSPWADGRAPGPTAALVARASPQGRIASSVRVPRSKCGRLPSPPAPARAPAPPLSAALTDPQLPPARPLRPLSLRHCPGLRSWVRPAALQPNNASLHRPSPRRAAQQRTLGLAGRKAAGAAGVGPGRGRAELSPRGTDSLWPRPPAKSRGSRATGGLGGSLGTAGHGPTCLVVEGSRVVCVRGARSPEPLVHSSLSLVRLWWRPPASQVHGMRKRAF